METKPPNSNIPLHHTTPKSTNYLTECVFPHIKQEITENNDAHVQSYTPLSLQSNSNSTSLSEIKIEPSYNQDHPSHASCELQSQLDESTEIYGHFSTSTVKLEFCEADPYQNDPSTTPEPSAWAAALKQEPKEEEECKVYVEDPVMCKQEPGLGVREAYDDNIEILKPITADDTANQNPEASAKIFTCAECDYTAKWEISLREHFRCKHGGKGEIIECPDCDYTTKSVRAMHYHFKGKHDASVEPSACSRCKYTTRNPGALRKHFRSVHENGSDTFTCSDCDFTTKCKDYLRVHRKRKHASNGEQLAGVERSCYKAKGPEEEGAFKTHVKRNSQLAAKPFKCAESDFVATTETVLPDHVIVEHTADGELYKCTRCSYMTKVKSYFERHKKTVHSADATMYRCSGCDFTTKWRQGLRKHFERKHTGNGETV